MEWRHASGQATLELVADLVIPPVVRAMVFDLARRWSMRRGLGRPWLIEWG